MNKFTFNRPSDIRHMTAALVLLAMLMAGCSQQATKPAADSQASSPEAIVEQRAKQRWELVTQREFMAAYDYLTPGYRATTPIDIYSVSMRRTPVKWQSAQFQSVACKSENVCIATFNVEAVVVGQLRGADIMPVSRQVQDEWLRVDGQWYYVMP